MQFWNGTVKLSCLINKKSICIFFAGFLFFPISGIHAYLDYPYSFNFQTIRSPLMPLGDEILEEGNIAVRANVRWINVWSYQRNYFIIDGEEFQIEPNFRYALSSKSQIGISMPLIARGGGFMDSSIESFHSAANVSQGHRDVYPENTFNVSYEIYGRLYPFMDNDPRTSYLRNYDYRTYPREPYDQPYPLRTSMLPPEEPLPLKYQALLNGDYLTYFLMDRDYPLLTPYGTLRTEIIPVNSADLQKPGDPRIHYQRVLLQNGIPGSIVMGGIQIKFPVNSGTFFSTPGADGSVFLTLIRNGNPRNPGFSLGISYTEFKMRDFYGIRLPSHQWVLRAGIEKHLKNSKIFSEYVYFSKPTLGMGELSRDGHQISAGLQKDVSGFKTTFAVIENFVNFGVTPDIGFQISSETIL